VAKDLVRSEPREAGQGSLDKPQRAVSRLQIGDRFSAVAEIEVTPAGLLAIGGMVGAILLSAAITVRAARR
jgi:hypothetical protein